MFRYDSSGKTENGLEPDFVKHRLNKNFTKW